MNLKVLLSLCTYILFSKFSFTQDTLYIFKSGEVIYKSAIADIDSITFINSNPMTYVSDFDGNQYGTITIGTQTWLTSNLKSTRYRNGDTIETTSPDTLDISAEFTSAYQWSYGGERSMSDKYGLLYTWSTVSDDRKICPSGWHVPDDSEWTVLTDYLGGEAIAGDKLKEPGVKHWKENIITVTGETGFNALPGGYRSGGNFFLEGSYGAWWTSSEADPFGAWSRYMFNNLSEVARINCVKTNGFSVRCIKD